MNDPGHNDSEELLAALLSHDLRQPLNVLRLFSAVHSRRYPEDTKLGEAITRAVTQLDDAFQRLVVFLRAQGAEATPTAIGPVWDALDPALTADIDRPQGTAPIDASSLESVLAELVRNARQHGRPPYRVTCNADASGWSLAVEDGGDGFDAEWAKGRRLSAPGRESPVALGLALVHKRIAALDGVVRVGQAPTVVTVHLPT